MILKIKSDRTVFILFAIVSSIFLLSGCGSGDGSTRDSTYDTGSLNFHVVYDETGGRRQPQAAVIDCAGLSVATVEAAVYDPEGAFLAGGGPWDCDAGQGTVLSVPAGADRTVAVFGKDADENIVFSGEKAGVQVDANHENDAGPIDCHAFIPSLQIPSDGSVVDVGVTDLGWNDVTRAAEYRLVVSENGDLSDPIVNDTTTTSAYTPSGLSNAKTYYWQVVAFDLGGNRGAGSAIWSFSGSDSLVAHLEAPANGSVVDVNAVDLDWSDVSRAAEYHVTVSQNSDLTDPIIDETTTASNLTPVDLSNAETYYWQVFAIDSNGNSGIGSQIWSFNGSETFVASLQAPPDGSVVNVSSVDLNWDDVSGAAEYQVIVSENSNLANPILNDTSTASTYMPSGLSNTKIYYWQVIAIDSYGNSGIGSAIWSFFDGHAFVPNLQAPADGAEVEVGAIGLEWNSVTGAAEYQVVVSENSDLSNPVIDAVTAVSSYAPSGLAYEKTYYWQIFAIDGYANKGIGSHTWSFDTESLVPVELKIGDNTADDFPDRFFVDEIWEGYDTDYDIGPTITIGDSTAKPIPPECSDGLGGDNHSGVLIIDTVDFVNHTIADRGNSDIRLNLCISESDTAGVVELHSLVDKPTIPEVTGCNASDGNPWTIPKADKLLATVNVTGDSTGYVEFSSAELDDYVTDNKGAMLYFILRKPDGIYQVAFYTPNTRVSGIRPYMEIDTIPQQ